VAGDAPTHQQLARFRSHGFQHTHLLHIAVACLASYTSIHMTHVGKTDVIGDLVDPSPRDWGSGSRVSTDLFHLFGIISTRNHEVTTHARIDGGNTRVYRPLSREVAVLAVDLKLPCMGIVGELDGLEVLFHGGWRCFNSTVLRRILSADEGDQS